MKLNRFVRSFTTATNIKPQICIVGSGPAGFYAAQQLANKCQSAQVDIYERLPVPFGLVRYGVAPDHQDLKRCINTFTKTAQLPNVRYLGNISLGKDVSFRQLQQAYHIVLLTYGVDDGRKINVNGEDLGNVLQAKNFVGWYNGLPSDKNLPIDLSGSRATIFGHGNVAIDVARILLSPIDKLKTTDITEHALATLSTSKIKEVSLVGRRGPLQVSFTTKELRELFNLNGCCSVWRPEDLTGVAETIPQLVRPRKRLTELIVETFQSNRTPKHDEKLLKMIFLRSPKEFRGDIKINSAVLNINRLEGNDLIEKKAVLTGKDEVIETDLVINSIGYKSVQADNDIPFDTSRGIVKCTNGKIMDGVYSAGWLAKGPQGVLINTMQHAFGVAGLILDDLNKGEVVKEIKPGFGEINNVLKTKNWQVVEWNDWLKIDEFERIQGEKLNKPREKIVDVEEMLRIAAK